MAACDKLTLSWQSDDREFEPLYACEDTRFAIRAVNMSIEPQFDIKVQELQLDILKEQMGKLIGSQGKTIQNIQQQHSKCKIQTPPREKEDANGNKVQIQKDEYKFVPVVLTGKDQDVFKMAKAVDDVVDVCLAVLIVSIAPKTLQRIPDVQGILRGIQVDLPGLDTVSLENRYKTPRLVFEGYLEDVIKAYDKFLADVDRHTQ